MKLGSKELLRYSKQILLKNIGVAGQKKISLKIGGYLIFKNGEIVKNYKEEEVKDYMRDKSIVIDLEINSGKDNFSVYTCDLTQEYVSINANYRS